MVGTREAAAKLKIEPRELRAWLRTKKRGSGGERYSWHEKGLAKLAAEFKADAEKSQATAMTKHRRRPAAPKRRAFLLLRCFLAYPSLDMVFCPHSVPVQVRFAFPEPRRSGL
jgi:hypothetical protein